MSELRSAAVKNAADEKQVKDAVDNNLTEREIELADLQTIMAIPAGRRFLGRHLRRTGVFEDTFELDPILHARVAGIRWAGLQLLGDIKTADPSVLLETLQNQWDEENDGTRTSKPKHRTRRRSNRAGN